MKKIIQISRWNKDGDSFTETEPLRIEIGIAMSDGNIHICVDGFIGQRIVLGHLEKIKFKELILETYANKNSLKTSNYMEPKTILNATGNFYFEVLLNHFFSVNKINKRDLISKYFPTYEY